MKKHILFFLLAVGLALSSSAAFASNYGRYYCGDCQVSSVPPNFGDIIVFIRSTQITNQWKPGDTVTICDDGTCMDVEWLGSAWYPSKRGVYPNDHSSYKNDVSIISIIGPNLYDVQVVWSSGTSGVTYGTVTVSDLVVVGYGAGDGSGDWGTNTVENDCTEEDGPSCTQ